MTNYFEVISARLHAQNLLQAEYLKRGYWGLDNDAINFINQIYNNYQVLALEKTLNCYGGYDPSLINIDTANKLNLFNALLYRPNCMSNQSVQLYTQLADNYSDYSTMFKSVLITYISDKRFDPSNLQNPETIANLKNINTEIKLELLEAFGNNYLATIASSSSDNYATKGCITQYSRVKVDGSITYFQLNTLINVLEKVGDSKDDLSSLIGGIVTLQNQYQATALEMLIPPKDCGIKIDTKAIMDQALKYSNLNQIEALHQLGANNSDLAVRFDTKNKCDNLMFCEKTKPYNKYSFLSQDKYNEIIGQASLSGDQTCGLEAKHFENY